MYRSPKDHIIQYTNQDGQDLTLTLPWDASVEQFVEAFYLILRRASFTHGTSKRTFNREFNDTLS